jgi:hypothetical protein
MRGRILAFVAVLSIVSTGAAQAAQRDPVTRSVEQVTSGLAAACRRDGGPPEACAALDGRDIAAENVDAYKQSWLHRAHALQRGLDQDVPLLQAVIPHTHNAFNSAWYPATVSGSDFNQLYALGHQLDMDMRGIELDVHWFPTAEGMAPIMCHGQTTGDGDASMSVGCSAERHLREGLREIRAWLDAQSGPELILLYLENNLRGLQDAHDAAATTIEQEIGDLVERPATECGNMPVERSKRDIHAGRKRILIVGNCDQGIGAWGSWVHLRGPAWDESSSGWGDDYPDFPECKKDPTKWERFWDDDTWLSSVTGGGGEVTRRETRAMTQCGVNMPGFDKLTPEDPRLDALIWSWATDQPLSGGREDCAVQGDDARFYAERCALKRPFACLDAAGAWHVTIASGRWDKGFAACAAEFPGSRFAVPHNGYANELLAQAKGSRPETWLNYSDAVREGSWVAGGPAQRIKR